LDQQSRYFIPATNPGLVAFNNLHCPAGGTGLPAYCANLPNGIIASQTLWRPYAYGGNPLYDDKANHNIRDADAYRASAGLSGTIFGDIGWDAAVTWMDVKTHHQTPNEVVNRVQLALRGLGGPNCNAATGTPGTGPCMWFNPFSNGVAASAVNGADNPYYLGNSNPAVVNNLAVIDWMGEFIVDDGLSRIAVADLVFNGDLPFHLGGDNFAWAAGAQGRYERLTRETNDLSNMDTHACVDSADDGVPGCTGGAGVYTFYAGISEYDVSRNVYAVFGELNAPLLDSDIPGLKSIEMSAALRFEDYGGGIGSTTNPKISAKWQFFDFLALRASYGTTFRAPSPVVVATGSTRALAQFTDPRPVALNGVGSLYRPVDTYNNPNLIPETADTFNVGLIFQAGGFRASVDYYQFKFKDELTTETGADIYRTMFPSAAASSWRCTDAALLARFTFSGGVCSPDNFLGVRSNQINGPTVDTSGIDFEAAYLWDGVLGGDIEVGIAGNQILEYLRGAVRTIEGIQVAPPVDRVGTLELISAFYSYPEWKGNAFLNYGRESHNVRLDYRYTGSMEDRNNVRADGTLTSVDSYDQFDLTYRFGVTDNLTLMFAVQNISDAEPSFVRSQYNYDYTGANPLGRVFEIGAKMTF
jgi:iron complex outermembrane receptor protein